MAESASYAVLSRAELRLEFLHANSTTHEFIFGAVAELIDNSRDAGATRLDIYTVKNENLRGGFMLCFLDDGCGMTPREARDLVYFGRSSKRANPKLIGHYGNGLKSGSMRLGNDFMLFTKKENVMTCLLFSQTFCETEGLSEVIIPILSWQSDTRIPTRDDREKFSTQLSIICKYSPFRNEADLLKQFYSIYGKTGTLLVIYNLKLMLNGEPELDILSDKEDILIDGNPTNHPEQRSLRAYTSILYLDPRMRIFIQAEKVKTKRLPYCFYKPSLEKCADMFLKHLELFWIQVRYQAEELKKRTTMYPYMSSKLKQVATSELQKAQMELKTAEKAVKEAKCRLKQLQDSTLNEDREDALENEKRMREKLEDKQRDLRRPKKLFLTFGINIQNRSQDGMLIYSNNRLIRMFEKLGPQKYAGSYFGAGAVGIIDVPLDIMEPTHNKQAFANNKEYSLLLKSMECYLLQYWKDIGINQKGETLFWNDFGYLSDKWFEGPSETIQYKRRRAIETPEMVQCDICLKWRLFSHGTHISNEGCHSIWNCSRSPNLLENKCTVPEHLPSIPLGTLNPIHCMDDKEKLLTCTIQKHKRKQENLHSLKIHLIQPHTSAQHTTDSRTPAKDKAFSQRKTFLKDSSGDYRQSVKKISDKGLLQLAKPKTDTQGRQHPYQKEKHFLSAVEDKKDHKMPEKALEWEQFYEKAHYAVKKKYVVSVAVKVSGRNRLIHRVGKKPLVRKKMDLRQIIISDCESEDLPKYEEFGGGFFMQKEEKQEEMGNSLMDCGNCEKPDLLSVNSESGSTEALREDKEQAFSVRKKSHRSENSKNIPKAQMIETLTSLIKEILLNFLPACNISREYIASMCPEELLSMFSMRRHQAQNKIVIDKYEEQLFKKIQHQEEHAFQKVHAIETEINLCKERINETQEKLEHLRGKIAQLLLKVHPHLIINNLEHTDTILEECLNQENILK